MRQGSYANMKKASGGRQAGEIDGGSEESRGYIIQTKGGRVVRLLKGQTMKAVGYRGKGSKHRGGVEGEKSVIWERLERMQLSLYRKKSEG